MTIFGQIDSDLLYPDSDGKPMAENIEQYRWIVLIKENLEILFANNDKILRVLSSVSDRGAFSPC